MLSAAEDRRDEGCTTLKHDVAAGVSSVLAVAAHAAVTLPVTVLRLVSTVTTTEPSSE